jgi:hypothetical protein
MAGLDRLLIGYCLDKRVKIRLKRVSVRLEHNRLIIELKRNLCAAELVSKVTVEPRDIITVN